MGCVDVQVAVTGCDLPESGDFERWVGAAIGTAVQDWDLCVRVVDTAESAQLNQRFRSKAGATNVLSFPAGLEDEAGTRMLGDIVICAQLVAAEASAQNKSGEAHWAHLTVHGTLHLLGMDHEDPADAQQMEDAERRILARLGYPDPYLVTA